MHPLATLPPPPCPPMSQRPPASGRREAGPRLRLCGLVGQAWDASKTIEDCINISPTTMLGGRKALKTDAETGRTRKTKPKHSPAKEYPPTEEEEYGWTSWWTGERHGPKGKTEKCALAGVRLDDLWRSRRFTASIGNSGNRPLPSRQNGGVLPWSSGSGGAGDQISQHGANRRAAGPPLPSSTLARRSRGRRHERFPAATQPRQHARPKPRSWVRSGSVFPLGATDKPFLIWVGRLVGAKRRRRPRRILSEISSRPDADGSTLMM